MRPVHDQCSCPRVGQVDVVEDASLPDPGSSGSGPATPVDLPASIRSRTSLMMGPRSTAGTVAPADRESLLSNTGLTRGDSGACGGGPGRIECCGVSEMNVRSER